MTTDESAPSSPPSRRTRSREDLADLLLDVGATLAAYGCPSYRLEDVIRAVADAEGYVAEPFALPTGLFLRVSPKGGDPGRDAYRMRRLVEWGVDLERLTLVDEIFEGMAAKRTTVDEARARIREIARKPSPWPPWLVWCASTAASAAAAVFFRARLLDVLVAAIVGAVIAGSRGLAQRGEQRLLNDFLGGLFAAVSAWVATRVFPGASPEVIVLSGAISLFPGMTFTTGIAEVAQKNLVSGGARLMEAGVTLLLIMFGVALVAGFREMAGVIAPAEEQRQGLGLAWQAAALVVSSLAFAILFRVPKRWLWAALLSGATGYAASALALRHLPGHVAAFCAALAVCTLANGLARVTGRPAQLFQLPGLMLLVPGSFGFLGLGDFLRGNVIEGASKGFMMALVGAALVIGVLVANVIMPPRKLL